jgi:GntR family transcriptional regulator
MPDERHLKDQLAGSLRARIINGDLAPGALLPSEPELARTHGVSRTTARAVMTALDHEGLTTVVPGRGRVVRDTRRVLLPADRYLKAGGPAGGPWETACATLGLSGYTEIVEVTHSYADEVVAAALGLTAGDRVIARRNRMHLTADNRNDVVQLQSTYLDAARFGDTSMAEPPIVSGGIYLGLERLGYTLATAAETVTARMPTRPEAEELHLEAGTPVIDLRRTTYTDDEAPVLHVHLVLDGGRVSLAFQHPLS